MGRLLITLAVLLSACGPHTSRGLGTTIPAPPPPAPDISLTSVSGDFQAGPVGYPLSIPLMVQVTKNGFPVDGIFVTFGSQGGALSNGGGYAGIVATPQVLGWDTIKATAPNEIDPVTFAIFGQ